VTGGFIDPCKMVPTHEVNIFRLGTGRLIGFVDPCCIFPMKHIPLSRVKIRRLFTRFFPPKKICRASANKLTGTTKISMVQTLAHSLSLSLSLSFSLLPPPFLTHGRNKKFYQHTCSAHSDNKFIIKASNEK
jgi:hypothetical protein